MSLKGRLVAGTAIGAIGLIMLAGEAAAQQQPVEQAASKKTSKKHHKDAKQEKIASKPAATDAQPNVSNDDGRLAGDIVVVGLRENVKSARSAKRNAHQIVDVVLAQDIGKLPDKNVPEALARVPGVQIERDRGEGGKVRIRGLET